MFIVGVAETRTVCTGIPVTVRAYPFVTFDTCQAVLTVNGGALVAVAAYLADIFRTLGTSVLTVEQLRTVAAVLALRAEGVARTAFAAARAAFIRAVRAFFTAGTNLVPAVSAGLSTSFADRGTLPTAIAADTVLVVKAFSAVIAVVAPTPGTDTFKALVAVVADLAVTVNTAFSAFGAHSAAFFAAISAETDCFAVVAGSACRARLIRTGAA